MNQHNSYITQTRPNPSCGEPMVISHSNLRFPNPFSTATNITQPFFIQTSSLRTHFRPQNPNRTQVLDKPCITHSNPLFPNRFATRTNKNPHTTQTQPNPNPFGVRNPKLWSTSGWAEPNLTKPDRWAEATRNRRPGVDEFGFFVWVFVCFFVGLFLFCLLRSSELNLAGVVDSQINERPWQRPRPSLFSPPSSSSTKIISSLSSMIAFHRAFRVSVERVLSGPKKNGRERKGIGENNYGSLFPPVSGKKEYGREASSRSKPNAFVKSISVADFWVGPFQSVVVHHEAAHWRDVDGKTR